jgi:hypothetical protein
MESDVLILQVDPTAPGCNLTEITSPPSYEGRYIFNPNPFKIIFKEKDAEALRNIIEDKYPDCDVELHYGGQPIYYYYIALE